MSQPRALTFGSVAERYERYRPGYPEQVADHVLAGLGEPGGLTALEVGAGTGKATRLIAGRGVRVHAVEPDHEMCRVLKAATEGLPVSITQSTFEALAPASTVDIVYAAAAWHWTEPATRWIRAAHWLRPGGVVAALGSPVNVADDLLAKQVEDIVEAHVGDVSVAGAEDDAAGLRWPANELTASPYFTEVQEHEVTLHQPMASEDFVGLISTVSSYLLLGEDAQQAMLDELRAALPEQVEVRRDHTVHRAIRNAVPV